MDDCFQSLDKYWTNIAGDRAEVKRLQHEIARINLATEALKIRASVEQSLTIIYQNGLYPRNIPLSTYSELALRSSDIEA